MKLQGQVNRHVMNVVLVALLTVVCVTGFACFVGLKLAMTLPVSSLTTISFGGLVWCVVEFVEVVAPDPVVGVGSQDVLVITPVARAIQVCSIATFSTALLFCNCLANHAMI